MQLTDISTVIVLSVILSLLFTEITGILPAGLVVPGYLTLLMKTPQAIFMTFIISVLTYLIVFFGVSKVTILYGKRKFIAMIIVAILLQFVIRAVVLKLGMNANDMKLLSAIIVAIALCIPVAIGKWRVYHSYKEGGRN